MARERMVTGPPPAYDTDHEMAWRHVQEAEDRVVRQTLLVDSIDRFADERVKRLSRDLLVTLRQTLRVARLHLHLIEAQARRDLPGRS